MTTSFRAVYKTGEGSDIDAEIFTPAAAASGKKYPILINIHGGAWTLGSSHMVNKDQIKDCLGRGWIVVVPQHRLCPGVDLFNGPMKDIRDLLAWIYSGELQKSISGQAGSGYDCDYDNVLAFGTSSGGHLALCLGFDVPRPVKGILDFYGACDFANPAWTQPLPHMQAILPPGLKAEFMNQVYDQKPVPIEDGMSLEGQTPGKPNFDNPRSAFAMHNIANGTIIQTVCPSAEWDKVDPIRNIHDKFPPTFIVHGQADNMVPLSFSKNLLSELQAKGVKCELLEVPDEGHTFAGKMQVGSRTWDLQKKGFDFLETLL